MRTLWLLCAIVLLGCEHAAPAPSSNATSPATSPETSSDRDVFRRWTEAVQRQLKADAQAGITRTFVTEDDLREFLLTLTPKGFRPRPEFFRSLGGDLDGGSPEWFPNRMASYGRSHPDEVSRFDSALEAWLKPTLEQIETSARASIARWKRDPTTVLAEAKRRQRSALLVFCANWSGGVLGAAP
jgi:hypothetical protein